MNPHGRSHYPLKIACLPIPPPGQIGLLFYSAGLEGSSSSAGSVGRSSASAPPSFNTGKSDRRLILVTFPCVPITDPPRNPREFKFQIGTSCCAKWRLSGRNEISCYVAVTYGPDEKKCLILSFFRGRFHVTLPLNWFDYGTMNPKRIKWMRIHKINASDHKMQQMRPGHRKYLNGNDFRIGIQ